MNWRRHVNTDDTKLKQRGILMIARLAMTATVQSRAAPAWDYAMAQDLRQKTIVFFFMPLPRLRIWVVLQSERKPHRMRSLGEAV